jgi:hypothetical protein
MKKEVTYFVLYNNEEDGDCDHVSEKLKVGDYYARWHANGNELEYFKVVSRVYIPGEKYDEWTFHVDRTEPL